MRILLLPGDGIGPEIAAATRRVLETVDAAHGLGLDLHEAEVGLVSLERHGTTLRQEVLEDARACDGTVLGPVSHYDYPSRDRGGINVSSAFRTELDLYANIRPARSRPGLSILRQPMDLVIVRENTEGFYSDRNMYAGTGEFMPDPDLALSVRKISAAGSRRIAVAAFELARTRRKRVTAVHKANVLKLSDALFLREVRAVAAEYPDVELRELIVDAAAARLVSAPQDFDVLVTTNMFGDILSDEASELSGSLGLAGGLNVGDGIAVAQAQHGSAPDLQGQGLANPTSLILSAAMLLDWYGTRTGQNEFARAAAEINEALDAALAEPALRTRDLGGTAGTGSFLRGVLAWWGSGYRA